jgi:hypothetical protein
MNARGLDDFDASPSVPASGMATATEQVGPADSRSRSRAQRAAPESLCFSESTPHRRRLNH